MNEQIEQALAKIFEGYEETPDLKDFKEEIAANLRERVNDMTKNGNSEQEALEKAIAQLGDITEAADCISRQKRKEVIWDAYNQRTVVGKAHAIGYSLAGLTFIFGLLICAILAFSTRQIDTVIYAATPFVAISLSGFVYLGLTQETRTHYALEKNRSLLYALAALLLISGLFISSALLFSGIPTNNLFDPFFFGFGRRIIIGNSVSAFSALIPFVLPALAFLFFLLITEKPRTKPGALNIAQKYNEIYQDEKFGLLCATLWMTALGIAIALGMLVSWPVSLIVFPFAIAAQCSLQYFAITRRGKNSCDRAQQEPRD
ncbi:MAG: permease prefix domain 1-containing protein [Oscillospiraceae bacterium]|jgi:uncharacterized protein YhaN|nr:permease prefix domain 1-containing protein [Oscillospiraceae bacterium]